MRAMAIVMVAAAGLVAASAHAQPPDVPRLLGAPGPDASVTVLGTAYGTIPASDLEPGCVGFITEQPDFEMTLERPRAFMRMFTESSADLVLLVEQPDGSRVCDDDSAGNLNPLLDFEQAPRGTYKIWVGVYRQGVIADYTLQVTSQREPIIIEP